MKKALENTKILSVTFYSVEYIASNELEVEVGKDTSALYIDLMIIYLV